MSFSQKTVPAQQVCGSCRAGQLLEDLDQLEPRVSPLQEELDAMDDEDEEMRDADQKGTASEDGRSVNGRFRSRSDSMGD